MGSAKIRKTLDAVAWVLNSADRDFLKRQTDAKTFAEHLAWELRSIGMCTQSEYETDVLPAIVAHAEQLDLLRKRALKGEVFDGERVFPYLHQFFIVGEAIRDARRQRGWTQKELAKVAHTTQPVISRIERAATLQEPSIELLSRVLASLGKRLSLIASDDNGPPQSVPWAAG